VAGKRNQLAVALRQQRQLLNLLATGILGSTVPVLVDWLRETLTEDAKAQVESIQAANVRPLHEEDDDDLTRRLQYWLDC